MPTYAYRCESCSAEFERIQRFSDAPITRCPECRKNKVRRVIHAAGVIFKGSGWYVNDSKATNPASSPVASDGGESKSAESKGGEGAGSEAKTSDSKSSEAKGGETPASAGASAGSASSKSASSKSSGKAAAAE